MHILRWWLAYVLHLGPNQEDKRTSLAVREDMPALTIISSLPFSERTERNLLTCLSTYMSGNKQSVVIRSRWYIPRLKVKELLRQFFSNSVCWMLPLLLEVSLMALCFLHLARRFWNHTFKVDESLSCESILQREKASGFDIRDVNFSLAQDAFNSSGWKQISLPRHRRSLPGWRGSCTTREKMVAQTPLRPASLSATSVSLARLSTGGGDACLL